MVTIANMGAFLGPTLIGALKDRFGTHGPAFMLLGACGIVAALLSLRLRHAGVLSNTRSPACTTMALE